MGSGANLNSNDTTTKKAPQKDLQDKPDPLKFRQIRAEKWTLPGSEVRTRERSSQCWESLNQVGYPFV